MRRRAVGHLTRWRWTDRPDRRRLPWYLMLVVLLFGSVVHPSPGTALAATTALPTAALAETNAAALDQDVDALLADEPGVFGVVVMTPAGQTLYSRNSEAPFVAASLYKLLVMATVYELEAAGKITLEEPVGGWVSVGDALFAMIVYSDNDASHTLLDRVGGIAVVNQTAQALGLDHTRIFVDPTTLPDWPPAPSADSTERATEQAAAFVEAAASAGGADVTTPEDMARFFWLLMNGRVVSPDASAAMLAILEQQTINDRLPVLLPPGTDVAHKTGNLPGVIHDAGIVSTPTGPVIVAALAEAMPNEARATATIQRLALTVYETSEWLPRWETLPQR